MSSIKKVGVVGCGLMGSGIAQAAATAGFDTVVRDVAEPLLERGRAGIIKSLGRLVERGKIPAETREAALGRLRFVTELSQLRECDIVIEAVTEELELKNAVWHELDRVCAPTTIFASNTSSLTIASMADATIPGRPLRRPAFLQSGADDAAGRGGSDRHDQPGDASSARSPSPERWARSRWRRWTGRASS